MRRVTVSHNRGGVMTPETQDLMTLAQGGALAGIGIDKKVSRQAFESFLQDGRAPLMMDAMARGTFPTGYLALAVAIGAIQPPEGGRLHVLSTPVQHDRPWQEALEAAGPQTPSDYVVRQVGDQYEPTSTGTTEEEVLLVQGYGSFDDGIAWAEQYDLDRTKPRRIFAAAERHPNLHRVLGMNPMYIVATQECTFKGERDVCSVWFKDGKRESYLYWVFDVGSGGDWLGFARKRK